MIDQLMDHHIDAGQRFAQVNYQGFGRSFRVDGKQGACVKGLGLSEIAVADALQKNPKPAEPSIMSNELIKA